MNQTDKMKAIEICMKHITTVEMIPTVNGFVKHDVLGIVNSCPATLQELIENGFKVGDILYDSWGYEQTNIDFYQVIEVKPKSVIIRPIGQEVTEEGNMSGHTIPIKDCFTGEPVTKKLTGWWNGEKSVATISSKYGSISLWDGKPKYCSWYA